MLSWATKRAYGRRISVKSDRECLNSIALLTVKKLYNNTFAIQNRTCRFWQNHTESISKEFGLATIKQERRHVPCIHNSKLRYISVIFYGFVLYVHTDFAFLLCECINQDLVLALPPYFESNCKLTDWAPLSNLVTYILEHAGPGCLVPGHTGHLEPKVLIQRIPLHGAQHK